MYCWQSHGITSEFNSIAAFKSSVANAGMRIIDWAGALFNEYTGYSSSSKAEASPIFISEIAKQAGLPILIENLLAELKTSSIAAMLINLCLRVNKTPKLTIE